MAQRDWREKFPELAEAAQVAKEEGKEAADEEKRMREKRIKMIIIDFLSSLKDRYAFTFGAWSDGSALAICFSGRLIVGGKGLPFPGDLSRGVEKTIKGFFSTLGVRVIFLRKAGEAADWQDGLNHAKEKGWGAPVFCFSHTKSVGKPKHGRRRR